MEKNKKVRFIQKSSTIALVLGILALLLGAPSWISILLFSYSYLTIFLRECLITGKVNGISAILCITAILWIILREFIQWKFADVFGQIVLYSFFLRSGYRMLGKLDKGLIGWVVMSVTVKVVQILYAPKWGFALSLLIQTLVVFRFLDPILEQIALEHRRKRLAALNTDNKDDSNGYEGSTTVTE